MVRLVTKVCCGQVDLKRHACGARDERQHGRLRHVGGLYHLRMVYACCVACQRRVDEAYESAQVLVSIPYRVYMNAMWAKLWAN